MQDAGGETPLPTFSQYFDSALGYKTAVPTTKGSSNQQEKVAQKRTYKNIIHSKSDIKVYNNHRR